MDQLESKLHETLRYLGYTVGIFGGLFLVGLILVFIEPIIAFLMDFIVFVVILGVFLTVIALGLYFFLNRDKYE